MDVAKTAAFSLGPEPAHAEASVLLLHGFTGSPWEVRPLGEALAARGFHVRAPRLPGHGTTPEDFANTHWREWERAADDALAAMPAGQVMVAGLSMGALLSVWLAGRHPERVAKLALMAPVWRLKSRQAQLLQATSFLPWGRFVGWVNKGPSDLADPEALADAPRLSRYPVERVLDLFTVQRHAREVVSKVKAPALLIHAEQDHVIDFRGVLELKASLPKSELVVLREGYHLLPRDKDRARVADEVCRFFASR